VIEAGQAEEGEVGETPDDEVWSDEVEAGQSPTPGREPVVRVTDRLEERAQQHTANMQKWVLLGVGLVLILMFAGILGIAVLDRAFALEIARLVLPSLLGSGATIVGALFLNSGRRR
jgi:uncharacterized integral membrane protein